jgi:murein DD-endopeptidase MepM/ murein hydrolase activator NlpD
MIGYRPKTCHVLLSLFLLLVGSCERQWPETHESIVASNPNIESLQNLETNLPASDIEFTSSHEIAKNSNTYDTLRAAGLSPSTIFALVRASKSLSSLDRVSSGAIFKILWREKDKISPLEVRVSRSPTEDLVLKLEEGEWQPRIEHLPVEIETVTYTSVVNNNLWESADQAGMDSFLISQLAQIFAWQIDFSREVQSGDRWRIVVERKLVGGNPIGWGNILAAEYQSKTEVFRGVRFPQQGEKASYYDTDGSSLRKMFLKSPIRFGRITSRFSRSRFHPILKHYKPHNGVDYAAPTGTPVMAVGSGRVVFVGRHGGSGNMVTIQHNSIYKTSYLHLRGFAKGLKKGAKIEQGDLIGYVGQTGLATGPHLHFAFYENNVYVDPLGRKFPSADPVDSHLLSEFRKEARSALELLPDWAVARNDDVRPTKGPFSTLD